MPDSHLDIPQMMQRATTVLIQNVDNQLFGKAASTNDIAKSIGLRGWQLREHRLKTMVQVMELLEGLEVAHRVFKAHVPTEQYYDRWELHEEFRKDGVPPISRDPKNPWLLANQIQFQR